jgi:hypothetical protein
MLVKMVTSLFVWAKEQVYFPTEDEWKFCQTEHIENSFTDYLFFCIDGTFIEIWSPKDLKKYRVHLIPSNPFVHFQSSSPPDLTVARSGSKVFGVNLLKEEMSFREYQTHNIE